MNGRDLFGEDLAGVVLEAFGGSLRTGTLQRRVAGERDPDNLAAGRAATLEEYEFEGVMIQELLEERNRWGPRDVTARGNRRVLILARSLTVQPRPGDVLVLDGLTSVVEGVYEDPAQATFTCVLRD